MAQQFIVPSEHDKAEWSRMAQDAYRTDRNSFGHRYSVMAATTLRGAALPINIYDDLMRVYRQWLVFGWAEVENPT